MQVISSQGQGVPCVEHVAVALEEISGSVKPRRYVPLLFSLICGW